MRRRGPHRAIAGVAAAMALALAGVGLAAASQAG